MKSKAWICTVCGYIHQGTEPPDTCPICGATKELFEPYKEPEKQPSGKSDSAAQWRCLNCDFIHEGDQAPETCPVCGAPAERFAPYETDSPSPTIPQDKKQVIIVGGGIAGVSAAEAVRKTSPQAKITLVTKEEHLPYYRLNLTRYLAQEVEEKELIIHPQEWYDDQGIEIIQNTELNSMDPRKKLVNLRAGKELPYDTLVLTIGSHPFIPPFIGADKENVVSLRTKKDADYIIDQCRHHNHCLIIGGGLLGIETAGAVMKRDMNVTLCEGHGWLLPRQLNKTAGLRLEKYITSLGIQLRKQSRIKEIIGDERVRGILFEDGQEIPTDLVVITTGVRPNSYLARLAGIKVNQGILVNNRLESSLPDIYAAGDVAEHQGVVYGTWSPSQFQGTIAGINAAGGEAEFAGIPRSNMLKVLGYDLYSIGKIIAEDASYTIFESTIEDNYFFFLFHDNKMVGSILLGDTRLSSQVKKWIEEQIDCSRLIHSRLTIKDLINQLMH